MLLPIIGLIIGMLVGLIFGGALPLGYAQYLAVAAIAAVDTLLAAYKMTLEDKLDTTMLALSFCATVLVSCLLVFFSRHTGMDIYIVVAVALGIRIFQNINKVVGLSVEKFRKRKYIKANAHFSSEE